MQTNGNAKGEFTLVLNGQPYVFKHGTAALTAFQEYFVEPGAEDAPELMPLIRQVKRGRLKYVRAFLWAGIQEHHPGTTIEQLDHILDGSSPVEVQALLTGLGVSTSPDPADLKALGVDARPPEARATRANGKARRHGGARSTSAHGARG